MFQDILTDRLYLRRLHADDSATMFAYRCNPGVLRYQSWKPQSILEIQDFIADMSLREFNTAGWYQVAIEAPGHGLIGDCGIHFLENDSLTAEIGITISPTFQSMGYASEALLSVFDFLFVQLGKHRIFASVDPRNLASIALMKRLGLRQEAHFVQSLWFEDEWVDDLIFAMLETEWRSKRNASLENVSIPSSQQRLAE
jgi:RimJ/RimL family protein N-acetyltransferase